MISPNVIVFTPSHHLMATNVAGRDAVKWWDVSGCFSFLEN
ncbi:hypothetical protein J2T14_002176 [Paenibacillus harenae]|nr:hypothetical protein [Paenibacillus harenae]